MKQPTETQSIFSYRSEAVWSGADQRIARTLFDAALTKELDEVMQEAKRRASRISKPDDLWKLESYLAARRRDIDRRYEFRSSRRVLTLGRLLHENRIRKEELSGFSKDKADAIRSCAKFLSARAA